MKKLFALAAAASILGGCSNGGHAGALAPTAAAPASKVLQQVQIRLTITDRTASSARTAKFVAASTNGVLVQVYAHSDASHQTVVGASGTDVSANSSSCGGASGTRTCTVYIPAPAGSDDFVFTTYDQAPTTGTTFPNNANVLAVGTVTQTIALGIANVMNVGLGGAIASLVVTPAAQSATAGTASNYGLRIVGVDADGNAIVAGASDPYKNPITVTVSETGGSGHTKVTLGGPTGTGSSSVQVTQSSQAVTVL